MKVVTFVKSSYTTLDYIQTSIRLIVLSTNFHDQLSNTVSTYFCKYPVMPKKNKII